MNSPPLPVAIRDMAENDTAMVINSWLMSLYDTPAMRWMPKGTFFRVYHSAIEQALKDPSNKTIVASNPEEPDQIFGWAMSANALMHFIYVKKTYRRLGIASMLLDKTFGKIPMQIECTHWGRICEAPPYDLQLHYQPGKFWTADRLIHIRKDDHRQVAQ